MSLADPGGVPPARAPPTGSNSFVFAYVFAKKHPHRRSAPPPNGSAPPQWEILDLPLLVPGVDPGFDQEGGPQIVTGLKLPFWGLSFVEFWCWGLIFGGQGGPGPPAPLDPPLCLLFTYVNIIMQIIYIKGTT